MIDPALSSSEIGSEHIWFKPGASEEHTGHVTCVNFLNEVISLVGLNRGGQGLSNYEQQNNSDLSSSHFLITIRKIPDLQQSLIVKTTTMLLEDYFG